jgi:hypothetical protein
VDTKRDRAAGGNPILAERAVFGLNESAMRKVIRARQADTPVKAPEMAALMNCSNVGKTPAQSQCDDRNYGDHTEISEPLSNGPIVLHFSIC